MLKNIAIECVPTNFYEEYAYYIFIYLGKKLIYRNMVCQNEVVKLKVLNYKAYTIMVIPCGSLIPLCFKAKIFLCGDSYDKFTFLFKKRSKFVNIKLTDRNYIDLPIEKGVILMNQTIIPITNGKGSKALVDGTYNVTATAAGYDESTINPTSVDVVEGTNDYAFTISATGTLTLHVTDDGTETGVPIEGATFIRCDADGNTYGSEITTNADGDAEFANVPYAETDAPTVYYKQTGSDSEHEYDATLQSTTLAESAVTIQIANTEAATRNVTLTDANYENLPIADGEIIVSQ